MDARWGICVDRFAAQPHATYFVTHLHADHTAGLQRGWRAGPLYASRETARELAERWGLSSVCVVPRWQWTRIRLNGPERHQCEVAAIDAGDHCRGAVMWAFRLPDQSHVLVTGDYRIHDWDQWIQWHGWRRFRTRVDAVLYDTTFARWRPTVWPSREDAVAALEHLVSYCQDRGHTPLYVDAWVSGIDLLVEAWLRAHPQRRVALCGELRWPWSCMTERLTTGDNIVDLWLEPTAAAASAHRWRVRVSATWFIKHQVSSVPDRAVWDETDALWRVFWPTHSCRSEWTRLRRWLTPTLTQPCGKAWDD